MAVSLWRVGRGRLISSALFATVLEMRKYLDVAGGVPMENEQLMSTGDRGSLFARKLRADGES